MYRDDLDAAMARAEAAERRIQELERAKEPKPKVDDREEESELSDRTPMDDLEDVELLVRDAVIDPFLRECRGWWQWVGGPWVMRREAKIVMGVAVGFVLFCLALVP